MGGKSGRIGKKIDRRIRYIVDCNYVVKIKPIKKSEEVRGWGQAG